MTLEDSDLSKLLTRLGDRANVRIQNPVQFTQLHTELQPDVMLLHPREDFYAAGHTRGPESARSGWWI
jgi:hypothetical protein